jgi:hypothetical protein
MPDESGVIHVPKLAPNRRLQYILVEVNSRFPNVDFLAIEELRGSMAPYSLLWGVGTILAAIKCKVMVEVPVNMWRAIAKADPDYVKGDRQDAECILRAITMISRYETEL